MTSQTFADYATANPILAARIAAEFDEVASRLSDATVSVEKWWSWEGEPEENTPHAAEIIRIELEQNVEGEEKPVEGVALLIHGRRTGRLTPLASNVAALIALERENPGGAGPQNMAARFRMWMALDEPWFKDLTLLETTEDIPKEDYAEHPAKEQIAAFSLAKAIEGEKATEGFQVFNLDRLGPEESEIDLTTIRPVGLGFEIESRKGLFRTAYAAPAPKERRIGSEDTPWPTQMSRDLGLIHQGRRSNRLRDARKSRFRDQDTPMPGLKGDLEDVKAAARDNLATRRENYPWRRLLPPEEGLEEKASAFRTYADEAFRDLRIPRSIENSASSFSMKLSDWLNKSPDEQHPTTAWFKPLSFYPGYDLVVLTEHVGGRARKTALLWAEDTANVPSLDKVPEGFPDPLGMRRAAHLVGRHVVLDGTSPPFHAMNYLMRGCGMFNLSRDTAPDYLEFFCDYVHGEAGAFTVIEESETLRPRGFHHEETAFINQAIFPTRIWSEYTPPGGGALSEEAVVMEASVLYGEGLFRAIFSVEPTGLIAMHDDDPILPDMPVRSTRWTKKTRFTLSRFSELE